MDNLRVLTIGGSRNIGYFSSIRLLDLGATVTFLLRNPGVFDNDETIQKYVRTGKARLVRGDALVKEDVRHAWAAAEGDDGKRVDFLVFTVGGTPHFEPTKGFVISPLNLVTRSILNCLETLPTTTMTTTQGRPRIIAISSSGLTRVGHQKLPFLLKPVYNYFLSVPHADKCGAEEVLAHCAGWEWDARDSPGPDVLSGDWKASAELPGSGTLNSGVVVLRPALLTDGACRADAQAGESSSRGGGGAYVVEEEDLVKRWTVSRRDVAHFLVEGVIRNWEEWKGKRVSIAY